MTSDASLARRLGRLMNDGREGPWYARSWATFAAMYAFFPLGAYLMWRYRPWSRRLKWLSTIFGSTVAVISAVVGPILARRLL